MPHVTFDDLDGASQTSGGVRDFRFESLKFKACTDHFGKRRLKCSASSGWRSAARKQPAILSTEAQPGRRRRDSDTRHDRAGQA
jgi:hypothetical protein